MQKKYKYKKELLFTVFILLLTCIIGGFIIIFFSNSSKKNYNVPMYQYYSGQKYEYSGKTTITKKKDVTSIQSNKLQFELDTNPIYFNSQPKIVVPSAMAVVLPEFSVVKRVNYLSEISEIQQGDFVVEKDKKRKIITNCFLFDGKNLYIFLEKTTITYKDKTIELDPLSFVSVNYNQSIEIFDYKNQKHIIEQTGVCDVMAAAKSGYQVNLSTDTLLRNDGQQQLLFTKPELLSEIK